MKNMITKAKAFFTPKISYSELPSCIQKEFIKASLLCIFLMVSAVIFCLKTRMFLYFLYGMLLILGCYICFILWYCQFTYGRAVYMEGTITDVKEHKPGFSGFLGKFLTRMIVMNLRYTIHTDDGLYVEIYNTSLKKPKVGQKVRIYYLPANLYTSQIDNIRLSGSLYTEAIHIPTERS